MRPRPVMGIRVVVLAIALGLVGVVTPRQMPPASAAGPGDLTPPSMIFALEWTGPNTPVHDIILLWDDRLDQSVPPDPGDFEVRLTQVPAASPQPSPAPFDQGLIIDSVEFSHDGTWDPTLSLSFMTLYLHDPVTLPGDLTVSYTPGLNPVQDEAGNDAEPFVGFEVEILESSAFEAVLGLVDGSYGADHVGLVFSDPVTPASLPPASAFIVKRNGTPVVPTNVAIFPSFGGRILDLTLPVTFRSDDIGTITYTAPGGGGIRNVSGTLAPNYPETELFLLLAAQDSAVDSTPPEGGTVSTDAGDPGPTAQDPIATNVTLPGAATVSIDEGKVDYPPDVPEYTFIGETVEIVVSPAATAANPIVIDFAIDASILTAAGVTEQTVQLLRNSVPVPACTGALGTAVPLDPCIESRTAVPAAPDPLEYAVLRVNTSQASVWTFAARNPFPWAGFRAPVNDPPTVNVGLGGLAIPVRFTLGGDQGMAIFAPGYPKSERVACPSGVARDLLEVMLPVRASSLHYGTRTGVYTYIWKTERAWSRAPAGPCRKLTLGFVDGTVHEAIFRFR